MEINQEWIDQQRAVCNAATVAPWSWNGDVLTSHWTNVISVFDNDGGASFTLEIDESDRAFIAISRTALPAALDEIERLAADNRKLREAHELAQSGYGTYTHTGNENAMQREAKKDATIASLTAELAADKSRANAAEDFNRRLRGIVREKMCVGCAWESGGKICRQVTYSQCRLINEIRDAQEEMP